MNYYSDPVLRQLLQFADQDDNIRAVLMEGSRAFGKTDEYSDYDIVYVTISSEPYFHGAILPFLVGHFGDIAVMQTPDNGDPHDVYTHLIQFANGIRIDLTFNSTEFLSRTPLESATTVLIDKDERFVNTAPPSDSDFWLKKPTAEIFSGHCNQFWWCSPYVAKACARGQTLHAMALLGECIREEYACMLSFLAGVHNNWERVNQGKHRTDIKHLLAPEDVHYYDELINSYIGANNDEIRLALDRLMTKYHTLAAKAANTLGFTYNFAEADKTMDFIRERFKRR